MLFLFFACFLTGTLAGKCCLDALFLSGLQVKGVSFDLLDDVFLLHLALETTQRVLEGLAFLNSDFRQNENTPRLVR